MIPFNETNRFTLHPDNSLLSEGGAQDERRHGPGHDPAIPANGHPDHAATPLAYKIALFTHAARHVAQAIAWLTIGAITFCILAT